MIAHCLPKELYLLHLTKFCESSWLGCLSASIPIIADTQSNKPGQARHTKTHMYHLTKIHSPTHTHHLVVSSSCGAAALPPLTRTELTQQSKKKGPQKAFQYDFSQLDRVESSGIRFEGKGKYKPLAWPEYLEYYTKEAPSYLSVLATERLTKRQLNLRN